VQYLRLYADKRGESHFEKVPVEFGEADYRPPAPLLYVSHAFQADGFQFVRLPSGWTGESIRPPKKQFLTCLAGKLEVTASDGEKHVLDTGDVVLMEDVDGKGHKTHVKGTQDCVAAIVPVA
jgi:quercetin dioxygenase-like cupin family protein